MSVHLRPPVAGDRLRLTAEGQVVLQLRHRWADGTRLVALIEQADVIQRILRHLNVPTAVPEPCPARAPPRLIDAQSSSPFKGADLAAIDPAC